MRDIFKFGASSATSEFCEWIQVGMMYMSFIVSFRSSLTYLHGFQLLVLLPWFIEIIFFARTNRINLLNLKESSDRLVIIAKGFLKLPNLHDAIKAKAFIICQKLGCLNFLQIANSVLNKGKSAIPPLYNAMVCI